MHTRHPFLIARPGASVAGQEAERIIVRIEHDGLFGIGEAAPTPHYNQSPESVERTLQQAAAMLPDRAPDDPSAIESIIDDLLARFDDQRAAVAAIDEALHDWLGKRRGLPLWSVLEGLGLDPARGRPRPVRRLLPVPGPG